MKELIIDRRTWRSGGDTQNTPHATGKGQTLLRNEFNYMCCLGFMCHQLGVPKKDLLDMGQPSSLAGKYKLPGLLKKKDGKPIQTNLTKEAIKINDLESLTRKEREKRLTELFKKKGIEVIFKNYYPRKIHRHA